MIIYGYRNREIEQASGGFHCTNCGVQRPYKHKKIVRYFTLFFIPLFPLGKLSEYVECQVCRRTYHTDVLSALTTTDTYQGIEEPMNTAPDPFSSPSGQKSRRSGACLSWGLILTGGLTSLFGCLMAFAGTAAQLEQQGDWGGYYAFLLLCPLPLVALGIILLIFGGLPLLKKRQIEDTLPD